MSTSRTRWRAPLRVGLAVAGAAALALVTSGIAEAHVTAQPGVATKGSYAKIAFRVPTESATAGTVKLEVTLPTDHPIPSVLTTPMPGWTASTAKAALNPPVETDDGKVTEAVRTITWTAQPGVRLGPGQFRRGRVGARHHSHRLRRLGHVLGMMGRGTHVLIDLDRLRPSSDVRATTRPEHEGCDEDVGPLSVHCQSPRKPPRCAYRSHNRRRRHNEPNRYIGCKA